MGRSQSIVPRTSSFHDLRTWLEQVDAIGQLERVPSLHWDLEMGAFAEIILERLKSPPALMFENIPDDQQNSRILVHLLETIERAAFALNISPDLKPIPFIDTLREKLRNLRPLEAQNVSSGPIFDKQESGKEIDLLKYPIPRWHEGDGGRYIGTGHLVITRDPETGDENIGCYRVMVHDRNHLALYISPGKHGRIHREKTLGAGKPFPVAMVFGQHPLMFIAATQSVPIGVNEYEWAGGIVGEPIQLIEGPLTGLRIPAAAEIAIEGEIIPGEVLPEGPFGEWTGYYASARRKEPVVNVKAIYHRENPIMTGAPPFKPTIHGSYRSLLRGAMIWNAMEQAGVPDIRAVYLPPPAQRFMIVVAIKQRYPGHAKQAATIACQCQPGAYLGRYVVVVDDDIDVTNLDEVIWAITTRSDPASSIDIIHRTWSGPLDPIIPTERKGHNSRAIIDATQPYEWRDQFPAVSQISDEKRREVTAKWEREFSRIENRFQKATKTR